MKYLTIIFLVAVCIFAICFLWLPRSLRSSQKMDESLEPSLKEKSANNTTSNYEPIVLSEDDFLKLATAQQSKILGEILDAENDQQKFVLDGKTLFQARRIEGATISETGVIALSAITGSKTPVYRADISSDMVNGRYEVSYYEIWILEKDKEPKLVSPKNFDARCSLISPDGKRIAFIGAVIDEKNVLTGLGSLHVLDVNTGRVQKVPGGEVKYEEDHIAPIEWVDNGKMLRVFTETSAGMKIIYLPAP